ncbi:uncharacterized protein [Temnothorax longispinosus]|uniref:uncharacterized protein n=1 Tax=Temnothorax longispinosus TaxID=300112 RepID=UPI003A9A5905
MPIGYGYSHSATNSIQLARCIKEWLLALIKCGFKPVASVCDQGGTNIAAINLLIQQTRPALHGNEPQGHIKDNTIFLKNHKIIPLFDYVHLQKSVQNNLLTKHLMLNKNVSTDLKCPYATWDAIERLYTIDKLNSDIQQRIMPKLVDKHIYPALIPKMRVKYAVQVLSHTVAHYMAIVVSYKQGVVETIKGTIQLPESAAATSRTLLFFDELLDSSNGKQGQGLSSIISPQSTHKRFWQKALFTLDNMQFVEKTTLKPIRRNAPKCLKNWMWTIRGAARLWDVLQRSGFTHLNLKYINQDVLENFFGQIRDVGRRNVNPTPYQFGTAFKTLITANITSKHSVSSNCEENKTDSSLALMTMFRAAEIARMENNDTNIDCAEAAVPIVEARNVFVNVHKILSFMRKKWIPICSDCAKKLENEQITNILQQAIYI